MILLHTVRLPFHIILIFVPTHEHKKMYATWSTDRTWSNIVLWFFGSLTVALFFYIGGWVGALLGVGLRCIRYLQIFLVY